MLYSVLSDPLSATELNGQFSVDVTPITATTAIPQHHPAVELALTLQGMPPITRATTTATGAVPVTPVIQVAAHATPVTTVIQAVDVEFMVVLVIALTAQRVTAIQG